MNTLKVDGLTRALTRQLITQWTNKKNNKTNRAEKFEFPNFDRLDAENAQFWPENRILHAKLYI